MGSLVQQQGTAVRTIEVEGYALTIAGEVRAGGESVGYLHDPDCKSVAVAGNDVNELVANAYAAGLHAHDAVAPADGNVSVVPLSRVWPWTDDLLPRDGVARRPWE